MLISFDLPIANPVIGEVWNLGNMYRVTGVPEVCIVSHLRAVANAVP